MRTTASSHEVRVGVCCHSADPSPKQRLFHTGSWHLPVLRADPQGSLPETGRSRMGSPVHRVSLGDTWSSQVHPDIDSERHSPSFSVERLTNILDGGISNTMLRRRVGKQSQEAKS